MVNVAAGFGLFQYVCLFWPVLSCCFFPSATVLDQSPPKRICRITSYNVCYTKLLRLFGVGPRYSGSPEEIGKHIDWPATPDKVLPGVTIGVAKKKGTNSVNLARITSYNVCYTKLLRIHFYRWF